MVFLCLPSGKHTNNYGTIHHALHGKTHELSMAIFNSYFDINKGYQFHSDITQMDEKVHIY